MTLAMWIGAVVGAILLGGVFVIGERWPPASMRVQYLITLLALASGGAALGVMLTWMIWQVLR